MTQQWEALIVGIDEYPIYTTLHNLTVARKDAEDVTEKLRDYGYESFRIQCLPQQPHQKGEEPNKLRLGVRLDELRDKITNLFNPPSIPETPDLALFFFSGHGWRKVVDGNEDVFLATSDVFPQRSIYGISLRWLGEQIQRSRVKKVIVWLDCCFSGELIKYLPTDKDYCLITATRSFETGLEISYSQGLFTQTLLAGLSPDSSADGLVDSHKLAKFVEKQMMTTSQRPLIVNSGRSILLTTRYSSQEFRDQCPYRSLNYFRETPEDATVFYGRYKLTSSLIKRVQKDRFIAILGASGSGKSSLLRAGLLYQLKLGQLIPGSNLWTYLTPFSPTENPLQRLEEVGSGITDNTTTIMIIDQFEECFTMCDETTRKAFFERLIELLDNYPNLHLVIGMRSDFRGRLREYSDLVNKIEKPYINVEHLNHEEIEEAIIKPAEIVGLLIEGELKQQLINDVEDYPGSLPLLQYTLTQLWQETRKQGERFLTLRTYQDLGGIEGTLEIRADEVFNSLPANERAIAQRIFLELTQIGDTFDTRRRVYLHELVNSYHSLEDLDKVTQKLANEDNRLLVRTQGNTLLEGTLLEGKRQKAKGKRQFLLLFLCRVSPFLLTSLLLKKQTTENSQSTIYNLQSTILIDVVHEALIRNWGRLRKWQDDYRDGMVIERKIEAAAKEWENNQKKTEYLLQRSKLGEAQEYVKNYGQLGMLDGMAESYIDHSITQDKHNRLRRNLTIGGFIGVVLLGAMVSTFFGLDSNKRATIATIATLKQQATIVKILFPVEPLDALVLAIATTGENISSWQVKEILPEVRSSLYEAIDQSRERNTLKGHQSPVTSLAIAPDGQTIVSSSSDNTVKLWSTRGQLLHTLKGHQSRVTSLAIAPDGQTIVSGSDDNTVKVWRLGTWLDWLGVGCRVLTL